MTKEGVILNLEGITTQLPFRQYYEQRNGNIARDIAAFLGLPYLGIADEQTYGGYVVPPKTITKQRAGELGIAGADNFYGLAVEDISQVDKSILHPCVSVFAPERYLPEFAKQVEGLVLPGVTSFGGAELVDYYRRAGGGVMRLKMADKSDGHGQYTIDNATQLGEVLKQIGETEISQKGMVMESEVFEGRTVSVGAAIVGKEKYTFVARQKNDIDPEDGRNRYLGAEVIVVKDRFEKLSEMPIDETEKRAVFAGEKFFAAYAYFNPLVSRLSFDFLTGINHLGGQVGGITDITGRLGGTCPAIMEAIKQFHLMPGLKGVLTEVTLNYQPKNYHTVELGAVPYVDTDSLRITAKTKKIYE